MPIRRLILMRHAKSSWSEGTDDLYRPLSVRGRREARAAATALLPLAPDLMVASPASRCVETIEMLGAGGLDVPQRSAGPLYSGDINSAVDYLRTLPGANSCVLVVCNYPTVAQMVGAVARREAGNPLWKRMDEKFPTCAYAVVEIDGSWTEVGAAPGRLIRFEVPRT